MDFDSLKYYVDVAKSLNFTKAARKNFISQPAISAKIKSLEAELNQTLLIRDHHSVTLTPAGESFLQSAQKILADYNQSLVDLWQVGHQAAEPLRVSMYVTPQFQVFINQLVHFKTAFNVDVKLSQRYSSDAIGDVLTGKADLGLGIVDHDAPQLNWHQESPDQLIVLAAKKELDRFTQPLNLKDLQQFAYLKLRYGPEGFVYQQPTALLTEANFNGQIKQYSSLDLMLTELLMEPAFTILPQSQIPQNVPGLGYATIATDLPTMMSLGWCYPNSLDNDTVAAFLSFISYDS
ncbi:LysR family transcriptional regulator [Secundilactobacillus muriivasis]